MSIQEPTKIVVLSQPRTGSTLVCSLLNSVPGSRIICEPINPRTHSHHMKPLKNSERLLPEYMVQNNLSYALQLLFNNKPLPEKFAISQKAVTKMVGFKIMAHQLMALKNEQVFWDYLVENNVKVVLVFRYNIVMQYISDLIVQVTEQPACWDGNIKTAKVIVPIESLENNLRKIITEKRYLIKKVDDLYLNKRRLKYEDFKDNVVLINKLIPWLIGENANLTTKLSKQNPNSMKARVKNYNELVQELQRLNMDHLIVNN